MNSPTLDKAEDKAQSYVDSRNGVTDLATYIDSLKRPASSEYIVMPDGTVQFIR